MSFWKALLFFVIASIFIVGSVWLSAWLNKTTGVSDSQIQLVQALVSCSADSLSYSSLIDSNGKVIKLIDHEKSVFANSGRFVNSQIVVTKNETKDSKVACGYLKVVAGTKDFGALQGWENIYINPDSFGGHIDSNGQIGRGDGRNFSEYVFPLNKIKYWKTRSDRSRGNLSEADWSSLFNVSEKVTFEIALNTNNRSGFIQEVSIAYKCWDPKTGKENDKCELKVSDNRDTESVTPVQ